MKTILASVLLLFGPYTQTIRENLEPKTFQQKFTESADAVLLDVRTPAEVDEGFIEGAVFIDYNSKDFKKKLSALDKTRPYFVYCAVGGRSSKTLDMMETSGFKILYHLEGGIEAWKKEGLKTERKK